MPNPTSDAGRAFLAAAAWDEVKWDRATPNGKKSSWPPVTVEAPPPAAAVVSTGASTPTVRTTPWDDVSRLDTEELCTLLLKHDGDPPTEHLAAVCARIEQITGQKAPMKLAQKRVTVSDWVLKNAPSSASVPRRQECASSRGSGAAASPAPAHDSPRAGVAEQRSEAVGAERCSCVPAAGSTQGTPHPAGLSGLSEADVGLVHKISELRNARGQLHVPAEQLPAIMSEVLQSMGRLKSPASLSARRRLIEDWYLAALEKMGGEAAVAQPSSPLADELPTRSTVARLQPENFGAPATVDVGMGSELPVAPGTVTDWLPLPPSIVPPPAASLAPPSDPLSALFARVHARECEQPLSAEMREIGEISRRCALGVAEASAAARLISDNTGALPAGSSDDDLANFVSDWYRWQVHLSRGAPIGGAHARGAPATPSSAAPPHPFSQAMMPPTPPPATVGASPMATPTHCSPRMSAIQTAAVPPLPLPLQPPSHAERTPGADPGASPSFGSSLASMYSGGPRDRPLTAPPSSGGGGSLSARSLHDESEDMTEEQVMAELHSCLPPSEAAAFVAASVAGRPLEVQLGLTPTRLAALGKQIELLSGRRVPALMKQKRDFVLSWWRQAIARNAHQDMIHSPSPQPSARRVDSNPVRMDAEPKTPLGTEPTAALRRLLREYGPYDVGSEGAAELRVPVEHLQIVCSQAEQLSGSKAPRQPRARREWLASLAMQVGAV